MNSTTHLLRARRRAVLSATIVAAVIAPHAEGAAYVTEARLWPGGLVPVQYDADLPAGDRLRIQAAFAIWEAEANIRFVGYTNQPDFLVVRTNPTGGSSSSEEIGRDGGVQYLNLNPNLAGISDYGLAHEVAHVLGYYHPFRRPDRNLYITWYEKRTQDCGAGNYQIVENAIGYPRNAMDFDSVMGYGECLFNTCGVELNSDCDCNDSDCNRYFYPDCNDIGSVCCPRPEIECCGENPPACRVLEIVDPDQRTLFQAGMGQRSYLSDMDALVMSFMYPEPGTRFLENNYSPTSESGTFHNPYVSVESAYQRAPNGTLLLVHPAVYQQPASILDKPMLIRPARGNFVIR